MRLFFIVALLFHVNSVLAQAVPTETPVLEDIAWSPDGTRIAGVYHDSHIAIWYVNDLTAPILMFQPELADTVTWTSDSQYLVVQGRHDDWEEGHLQTLVTKWDVDTGELSETLLNIEMDSSLEFNHYGYNVLPSIAFDSAGTQAAFSFRDGSVLISDGLNVLHLDNVSSTDYVHDMVWSPNNRYLAVVYGSTDIYTIQVFDVESGELILTILQDFQYFVTDLAWNAAGTHLATSSRSISGGEVYSNIGIYKIEPYEPPFIDSTFWRRNIGYYGFTAQIDWHPTDYILAYASEDAIEIYDPSQEGALLTIAVDEAKDIEWSPDGTQIASVSRDGTLAIWDVSL